jgi:acetylornithine deacetylase/succinyl-diaminopimelate desuccinylase-like protein
MSDGTQPLHPMRTQALDEARRHVESGEFAAALGRRVAHRTASPVPGSEAALRAFLQDEIGGPLGEAGFEAELVECGGGLFALAQRHEGSHLPTLLLYGHGDTVPGMEGRWTDGRDPWTLAADGERLYGRGAADNKGQYSVNIAAIATVLKMRGALGFNVKLIVEMGEELGSPGLRELCHTRREALAADVLVASDGPRLSAERPTLFLGSRGVARVRLVLHLREGAHHSGNWGGLLSNAGIVLANAIAACVDQNGILRVARLRPEPVTPDIRAALTDVTPAGGTGEPLVEPEWGEPGLSPAERVFAANTLEVLAIGTGDIKQPAGAIPGHAEAVLQLRFVGALNWRDVGPILQDHLDRHGFGAVRVTSLDGGNASRTATSDKWVGWTLDSLQRSTGKKPALLPNFGGTLPNDIFIEELGLPTLWIPHSYPGCNQHAPDEHNLIPVLREGVEMMTGLFWDLGDAPTPG